MMMSYQRYMLPRPRLGLPTRRKIFAGLAACVLACLAIPNAIAGTEFEPAGGPGGTPFRELCPTGQYLVGARWRSGSWLDQISITCAAVDTNGATGPKSHGSTFGGGGGNPDERSCDPNQVITSASILKNSERYPFVQEIDLACKSTTSTLYFGFAVGRVATIFPDHNQHCADGQAVIGVHGRAGQYLDAIGVICGSFREPAIPNAKASLASLLRLLSVPRVSVPRACDGTPVDLAPADWSDMLNAHNERRKRHCVPPLTWSNKLAADAQAYADKCILNMHGSIGENLADAWAEANGNSVLPALSDRDAFEQTWYCEIQNYDFSNPQFKSGFTNGCRGVNGHFTQVVWKDTCQIGCGRATCDIPDGQGGFHKGTHWVCRYSPPGNINVNDVKVLQEEVLPTCK
jgi:hypothetical protein